MSTTPLPTTLTDRFLSAITPQPKTTEPKKPKRVVESDEFMSMLFRQIRALEKRAIDDPAILPMVRALGHRLDEVVNVAIAANAERYQLSPFLGASMKECARVLDIKPQSASERCKRGRAIMAARIAAAGVVPFAERRRERELLDAARDITVVELADWSARRRSA